MTIYSVETRRNGFHPPKATKEPATADILQPRLVDTQGFSKLSPDERYARLLDAGVLSEDEVEALQQGNMLSSELARTMIENHIGSIEVPMGVAVGVNVNGKEYAVPMCVEETSVIAAVGKTAKWINENGEATAEILGNEIIGQIQFPHVSDFAVAKTHLADWTPQLIAEANERVVPSMAARGGGVRDIQVREVARPDGGSMAIVHVHMDPCDAMGANIITQVCEFLRGPLEDIIEEKANMCILSNLADRRLVQSNIVLREIDAEVAHGIEEASIFAESDPYRAATHNKGIMNGIDPILLATGNDWRAVEAGAHAYATRSGQYRALSTWRKHVGADGNADLYGSITIPMQVATVGGVTRIHPTAQLALRMMDIQSSDELAKVTATVGLIQNLGALRALTTDGLVQGHMRLHIGNIIAEVGAGPQEKAPLERHLQEVLRQSGKVTVTDARGWMSRKVEA